MLTVGEIIYSLLFGLLCAYLVMFSTKKRMEKLYKEEVIEWWTPKRLRILFISFFIFATSLQLGFAYFN